MILYFEIKTLYNRSQTIIIIIIYRDVMLYILVFSFARIHNRAMVFLFLLLKPYI